MGRSALLALRRFPTVREGRCANADYFCQDHGGRQLRKRHFATVIFRPNDSLLDSDVAAARD
jgi:hypothetical protein